MPYRNSLMTVVLRDSLGGNCKTVMVANISGDAGQIDESISTCRFAQRVAMVTNEVGGWVGGGTLAHCVVVAANISACLRRGFTQSRRYRQVYTPSMVAL